MSLTRKHFQGLADVMKDAKRERPEQSCVDAIAKQLAPYLATTNPAFNRSKFLEACGVE